MFCFDPYLNIAPLSQWKEFQSVDYHHQIRHALPSKKNIKKIFDIGFLISKYLMKHSLVHYIN